MRFSYSTLTFETGIAFLKDGSAGADIAQALGRAEKYFPSNRSVRAIHTEFPQHASGVRLAAQYAVGLLIGTGVFPGKLSMENGDRVTYAITKKTPDIVFEWWMHAHGNCYEFMLNVPIPIVIELRRKFAALGWYIGENSAEEPLAA
jgi:hypothetical protein